MNYAMFKAGLMEKLKALTSAFARSTAPTETKRSLAPVLLNPLQSILPHRRPRFTGLEIQWLATRQSSALSYRAGRSKYAPADLKLACAAARLRAA